MRLLSETALARGNVRPDKPNEDFLLADDVLGVYIVCDGVTRTAAPAMYPVPSPSGRAAEIAAKRVMTHLASHQRCVNPLVSVRSALRRANCAVGELNKLEFPSVDFLERDLVGVVMAIAVVCGSRLSYGYIGDCAIRVLRGSSALRLTASQTEATKAYRLEHGSTPQSTVEIRRDFRNRAGSPYGYGCLTGEEQAQEFFITGSFDLLERDVVLMTSDGVEPAFASPGEGLARLTAVEILRRAALGDSRDASRSDDKALIRIEVADGSSDLVPGDA